MRIGADELILWLRKNCKAIGVPNDGFGGLGQKIKVLLCDNLGGQKVDDNAAVYWDDGDGSKNIGDFNLPKTAEQYEINISKLPDIYQALENW
jgi:hypothetical protein